MSFEVIQPGLLSLLQDAGRFGHHRIGLTNGGPLDPWAFKVANRLLQNPLHATAIEVSFGGLQLQARVDTFVCLCGADIPWEIDGEAQPLWQVVPIAAGQNLCIAYAQSGCRAYLAVAGGFTIAAQFGATSTVLREGIGGLNGDRLQCGDLLPCKPYAEHKLLCLAAQAIPQYQNSITVRVILGYQQQAFTPVQQRRFFDATYRVSQRCDRMGYRLEGPAISCEIQGILSEGICQGAIQIPADGQPIVLLNDRQTIGGYPKIGAVLSLDTAKLAQLRPGNSLQFCAIDEQQAHNALHLHQAQWQRLPIEARQ